MPRLTDAQFSIVASTTLLMAVIAMQIVKLSM